MNEGSIINIKIPSSGIVGLDKASEKENDLGFADYVHTIIIYHCTISQSQVTPAYHENYVPYFNNDLRAGFMSNAYCAVNIHADMSPSKYPQG
jgi:hypothetical protein